MSEKPRHIVETSNRSQNIETSNDLTQLLAQNQPEQVLQALEQDDLNKAFKLTLLNILKARKQDDEEKLIFWRGFFYHIVQKIVKRLMKTDRGNVGKNVKQMALNLTAKGMDVEAQILRATAIGMYVDRLGPAVQDMDDDAKKIIFQQTLAQAEKMAQKITKAIGLHNATIH